MNIRDTNWNDYYRVIQGREPRPLLLEALNRYREEDLDPSRLAIDIGRGDGTETTLLLDRG